jgi:predicted molibdopterin-dependent oxidoreductase YjgC
VTINLTLNGKLVQSKEGQTVLEAARDNGIIIPTLCFHKDLSPAGSCRLCMVEVDKMRGQLAACNLPVVEGMVVRTESSSLERSRRTVLSLLLNNYHDADFALHDGHRNEFEYWIRYYDIHVESEIVPELRLPPNDDPNPVIRVDFNKCILCTRCVRACAEVQGRFVWAVGERGNRSRIIAGADTTLLEARCESCGACVAYCPTGALENKMSFHIGPADRKVTTTCTYCGVGCQLDLNVKDGKIIRVTSSADAPVNGQHLCVKGRYGYDFIHHKDRILGPQVRRYLLEGKKKTIFGSAWEWVETDWDTALNITAKQMATIRDQSGGEKIGILTSAKCLNEENYLMNKLARQVLGSNNIDHCARL